MAAGARRLGAAGGVARRSASSPWVTLSVLCFSILMVNLDTTVLNVALPTLVRDLNASSTELQWIVDAYALVLGGLLLVAGSLGDRIGRKITFIAGLAAFGCGSLWAAFAGSVGMLIAARASMGIGGALMMPSTLAIITDVFRETDRRRRAIGVWAGTSGVGFALGPIVGGALLAHFAWGSVFLINAPIAVIGLVAAMRWVPDSKNDHAPRPDVVGALLSMAGLGLVLWAIIEAPVNGWWSIRVVAPGAGGLLLVGAFALWERSNPHPMLNLSFFRASSFSGAVGSMGLVAFGLVGSLFVLTQFLQFNLGYSAFDAGLRMLPIAAAIVVVSPMSALLVHRIGTRFTAAAGLLLVALGLWLVSHASISWAYSDLLPGLLLTGTGAALTMPSASASVMGSLPRGQTGVGSATNGTLMQIGGALGVAVVGSLLSTRYQDSLGAQLAPYHLPSAVGHTILNSIGSALAVAERIGGPIGALLASAARTAFISGANLGLVVAAAVAVVGCLVALIVLPRREAEREATADSQAA